MENIKEDDIYLLVLAVTAIIILYASFKDIINSGKITARLKSLQDRRKQLKSEMLTPRKRSKQDKSSSIGIMRSVVNKMNLLQKSKITQINKLLLNAGYRSKDAIFVFAFFQFVLPIAVIVIELLFVEIDFSNPLSDKFKLFLLVGVPIFAFKLPVILVSNARSKRYYAIQKALSDGLDLMLICAEAGLSLAASLDRVAHELGTVYPELAEEFAITSIELGFLPERKKAMTNLMERVDTPEIRGMVGVFLQTEKYGTPVAQALRVLAAEYRTQRMLRAEQKAARLPAIMTIPMIVFILPTLFMTIIFPVVLKIKAGK